MKIQTHNTILETCECTYDGSDDGEPLFSVHINGRDLPGCVRSLRRQQQRMLGLHLSFEEIVHVVENGYRSGSGSAQMEQASGCCSQLSENKDANSDDVFMS